MVEPFIVIDRYEPTRICQPKFPEGDLEKQNAHYKGVHGRILELLTHSARGVTLPRLETIMINQSTEIRSISRGDIRFLLDESLLGNGVFTKQVGPEVRYFLEKSD